LRNIELSPLMVRLAPLWLVVLLAQIVGGTLLSRVSPGIGSSPRPAAASPARTAQLAVAAPVGSTVQLTLISADGLSIRRLTDTPGAVSGIAWSPDGRRIAFVNESQGSRQIWVTPRNGEAPRALTGLPGDNTSPTWSRDGRRIAFISTRGGSRQLFVMTGDGGGVRQLTQDGGYRTVSWSPDGRYLAAVAERAGVDELDLYVIRPDGTARLRVNAAPLLPRPGMMLPAWSPDGRRLAYVSRVGRAEQEIATVSVDGRMRRRLSTGYAPAWSPDGRSIAFVVSRVGDAQIYVARPDGSGSRRLTPGSGIRILPTWAPDSSAIAFVAINGGDLVVTIMKPDGSGARRLLSTTGDLSGLPLFAWQPR
jgi:TolB protein